MKQSVLYVDLRARAVWELEDRLARTRGYWVPRKKALPRINRSVNQASEDPNEYLHELYELGKWLHMYQHGLET